MIQDGCEGRRWVLGRGNGLKRLYLDAARKWSGVGLVGVPIRLFSTNAHTNIRKLALFQVMGAFWFSLELEVDATLCKAHVSHGYSPFNCPARLSAAEYLPTLDL